MTITTDLRYPIGPFTASGVMTEADRQSAIAEIAALPARLREAVAGLTDPQLDTPYRPEGWTVRQVVHHVADSHMNGYTRVKLALTEESPIIKPYDEKAWSTLADMRLPVDISLGLLDALHARWIAVYAGMRGEQFTRAFYHPELRDTQTLDQHLQLYSWHSRHHVAHIAGLRQREGW
jgi:hypothetical protein